MSIRNIVSSLQTALLLASAPAVASEWRDSVTWQDRSAAMEAIGDGRYRLQASGESEPAVPRLIQAQPLRSDTASPLFDGLFALAQQELQQNRVDAIRDGAFDHGKPLPCDCFQTGAKWPYVWTRDLSYSADLALARLDPERTKRSLRFKLSDIRGTGVGQGLYVAQDTGSGGSWPISTDRVVWFLGARHLLDDPVFADETWRALRDTLAQDRIYAFDRAVGLYRGETSFLDWREQTYPAWTANDVVFIAESFALSTNALHYQALQFAAELAAQRGDADAATSYREQARALAQAIDQRFWNQRRGMYMSYIGAATHPVPFEAYDLLGISLATLSGAVPEARARAALANYPATPAGSPVIWPQQPGIAIYHNRAIWPFVSAYALKAARRTNSPERIAHELRSILRGAALAGSHMENYEFLSQRVHVEDGKLSGPVVNSPRQLWSVAGALDAVIEGVFGLEADGSVAPRLPTSLVPMLFGDRDTIRLQLQDRSIALRRPRSIDGNLLVAGAVRRNGGETVVELVPKHVPASPLRMDEHFAPPSPPAPVARLSGDVWQLDTADADTLYVDGASRGAVAGKTTLPASRLQQCISTTRSGGDGIESLHSPTLCLGEAATVAGAWPRRWTAPHDGRYRARLLYDNAHGPINTGVTAAVKRLSIRCEAQPEQVVPIVMPHSDGSERSTNAVFSANAGKTCEFALLDGFNMSDLRHFARYTGGEGGAKGALNAADIGAIEIAREH